VAAATAVAEVVPEKCPLQLNLAMVLVPSQSHFGQRAVDLQAGTPQKLRLPGHERFSSCPPACSRPWFRSRARRGCRCYLRSRSWKRLSRYHRCCHCPHRCSGGLFRRLCEPHRTCVQRFRHGAYPVLKQSHVAKRLPGDRPGGVHAPEWSTGRHFRQAPQRPPSAARYHVRSASHVDLPSADGAVSGAVTPIGAASWGMPV